MSDVKRFRWFHIWRAFAKALGEELLAITGDGFGGTASRWTGGNRVVSRNKNSWGSARSDSPLRVAGFPEQLK